MKVNKFIFPANFVILDMEENKDVSIIIEWLFLVIERILIYVVAGELIRRLSDEQVVFKIVEAMEYPKTTDDYFAVNLIEQVVTIVHERSQFSDPLEHIVTSKEIKDEEDEDGLAR